MLGGPIELARLHWVRDEDLVFEMRVGALIEALVSENLDYLPELAALPSIGQLDFTLSMERSARNNKSSSYDDIRFMKAGRSARNACR
jgi:hypothetical protein